VNKNIISNLKRFFAIFFIVGLALFFYLNGKIFSGQSDSDVAGYRVTQPKISAKNQLSAGYTDRNTEGKSIVSDASQYDVSDSRITSEWMRHTGKFTHEERADYDAYDEKTLIDFAKNGDAKAMDILSNIYVRRGVYEGDNLKSAQKYAEMAAIHGLVSTIPTLITLTILPADFSKNDNVTLFEDEKRSHSKLIEAEALAQIIAMRGDANLSGIMKQSVIQDYNSAYGTSITSASVDQNEVNSKATEIYNLWLLKRNELGLGEFESAPPSVKKYMEIINN